MGWVVGKVIGERGKTLRGLLTGIASCPPGLWACPQNPWQVLQRSTRSFRPAFILAPAVGNVVVVVVAAAALAIVVGFPGKPERPCILGPIWVCGHSWPTNARRIWLSSSNLLLAACPLPKLHHNEAKSSKQSTLPNMMLGWQ